MCAIEWLCTVFVPVLEPSEQLFSVGLPRALKAAPLPLPNLGTLYDNDDGDVSLGLDWLSVLG